MSVLPGVGLDVLADLVPARKMRVVRRHGEVLEVGHVPGRDQVEGFVIGVPVAADAAGLFEAVDVVARLAELLKG